MGAKVNKIVSSVFMIIILIMLYMTSLYNYILFHSIAEVFSVCIALTIFLITWNSKHFIQNKLFIILGISYLFIGFLDLLYMLSYKGMNIFTDYDYYANQIWIATRFLESMTLLISFIFVKRHKNVNTFLVFFIYTLTTSIIVLSVFYWKTFPICFIEGVGLTPFKIFSEYIILSILLAALIFSFYNRKYFKEQIYRYIALSILLTMFSELTFTLYIDNYGLSNLMGHYFKLLSFYLIYKAIIVKAIKEPHQTIFNELQNQVNIDGLTGLYNHRYLYNDVIERIKLSRRTNQPFSVIMMDVDHFKNINDLYGHIEGDRALSLIGTTIKNTIRTTDIPGRYGGEEFMVILPSTNIESCYIVAEKIRHEISKIKLGNNRPQINISAGIAEFNDFFKVGEAKSFTELATEIIDVADRNLYQAKSDGRNRTVGLELV